MWQRPSVGGADAPQSPGDRSRAQCCEAALHLARLHAQAGTVLRQTALKVVGPIMRKIKISFGGGQAALGFMLSVV